MAQDVPSRVDDVWSVRFTHLFSFHFRRLRKLENPVRYGRTRLKDDVRDPEKRLHLTKYWIHDETYILRYGASSSVNIVTALPSLPARPVRPIR